MPGERRPIFSGQFARSGNKTGQKCPKKSFSGGSAVKKWRPPSKAAWQGDSVSLPRPVYHRIACCMKTDLFEIAKAYFGSAAFFGPGRRGINRDSSPLPMGERTGLYSAIGGGVFRPGYVVWPAPGGPDCPAHPTSGPIRPALSGDHLHVCQRKTTV